MNVKRTLPYAGSTIATIASVAIVTSLAGFGVGAFVSRTDKKEDIPVVVEAPQACPEVQVIRTPIPSPHIINASRLMAAADPSQASVWFEQEVGSDGERRHMFFFKKEQPYSVVEVGAEIGLVSFRLMDDDRWMPEVINPQLFTNGTRGEVAPQSSFRFERVSGDQLVMLVQNRLDSFEGSEHFLDLFLYADGRFSPAGRVFVGANNSQMKCDGPTAKHDAYNRACMDFTGHLSVVAVPGQPMANLEVTFEGLKGDKYPALEKVVYRFTQGRYVQDREASVLSSALN